MYTCRSSTSYGYLLFRLDHGLKGTATSSDAQSGHKDIHDMKNYKPCDQENTDSIYLCFML